MDIEIKSDLKPFQLPKRAVLIGIPEETANFENAKRQEKKYDNSRHSNKQLNKEKPKYNNAELLALLEAGSPVNKLPPRPLLLPTIQKHEEDIQKAILEYTHYIIDGNQTAGDTVLKKLALQLQKWTMEYFKKGENNWEPNAPITIHGGWMKNKVTGQVIYVKGKKSDTPMIDTGSLRQAIRGTLYKGDV